MYVILEVDLSASGSIELLVATRAGYLQCVDNSLIKEADHFQWIYAAKDRVY